MILIFLQRNKTSALRLRLHIQSLSTPFCSQGGSVIEKANKVQLFHTSQNSQRLSHKGNAVRDFIPEENVPI